MSINIAPNEVYKAMMLAYIASALIDIDAMQACIEAT